MVSDVIGTVIIILCVHSPPGMLPSFVYIHLANTSYVVRQTSSISYTHGYLQPERHFEIIDVENVSSCS